MSYDKIDNPENIQVKPPPKRVTKTRLLQLRVTEDEEYLIHCLAETFTGGNMSLWIRHASLEYRPMGARKQTTLIRPVYEED